MDDIVNVLVVGLDEAAERELAEEGFVVSRVSSLRQTPAQMRFDAVIIDLEEQGPLEAVRDARSFAHDAAVIVITSPDRSADGAVALHAGAEDHLIRGSIPPGTLPRAVGYSIAIRRLRRELATRDEDTGLANLRGFAPIAEHHMLVADREGRPVVFVFLRIDDHAEIEAAEGPQAAGELVRDAASVLAEGVRDSDVPARIAPDTFCVLLTGPSQGAESLVLSRLIEALAVHDARREHPRALALSVGSALYEAGSRVDLGSILETAGRKLAAGAGDRST